MRIIDVLGEQEAKDEFRAIFDAMKHKLGLSGFVRGKPTTAICEILAGLSIELRTAHILIARQERRIAELEEKPAIEYRGVWGEREEYIAGSLASHQGGLWLALIASKGVRPNTSSMCWRLVVKRGDHQIRDAA